MENPEYLYEHSFLDAQIIEWIDVCREQFKSWFSLANQVNSHSLSSMFQLDAHNQVIHELMLASLYLRTLHNYQGAILMAERGMVTQARVLARAMLDSIFPLVAISKDHEFAKVYAENHLLQQVKYYEKAKKLENARIPEIDDPKNLEKEEELRKQIKDLGVKHITTEELARRADLYEWYLTAYALLSGTVHSRAGDLEEYLVLTEEQEIKELDWGPRTKGMKTLMMTAIESMLIAVEHIACISPKHPTKENNDFRSKLEDLVQDEVIQPEVTNDDI